MTVLCAHCGEPLMGAVNRCWKCGQDIASHAGPVDVPPIRRSPVNLTAGEALAATVLDDQPAAGALAAVRRGSPFAGQAPTIPPGHPLSDKSPLPKAVGPPHVPAVPQLAAIASVSVALIALFVSFSIPIAASLLSLFALGCGIGGLFGPRRTLAMAALVLACGVLGWSGLQTLVQVYEWLYGVHPFA